MICNSIWNGNDFSKCFQERYVNDLHQLNCPRYLKAAIPLVYIGISILVMLLTYTYTSVRSIYRNYKLQSNTAKLLATSDDGSFDSDEVLTECNSEGDTSESTLIGSLPQDTKVCVIENTPSWERAWVAAEIALLAGQVALSIFSIIKGEGWRSIAIAGHVQWVYLLIIALLRLLGTQRTRKLWSHSTFIYLFSCKDSQIEFFNNFRSELNVSISSFSNKRLSFIEKDLIETS